MAEQQLTEEEQANLDVLSSMGFEKQSLNLLVLRENKNNMDSTVQQLLKMDPKH